MGEAKDPLIETKFVVDTRVVYGHVDGAQKIQLDGLSISQRTTGSGGRKLELDVEIRVGGKVLGR